MELDAAHDKAVPHHTGVKVCCGDFAVSLGSLVAASDKTDLTLVGLNGKDSFGRQLYQFVACGSHSSPKPSQVIS